MIILIPYMPENLILGHIDESAKDNKKFLTEVSNLWYLNKSDFSHFLYWMYSDLFFPLKWDPDYSIMNLKVINEDLLFSNDHTIVEYGYMCHFLWLILPVYATGIWLEGLQY